MSFVARRASREARLPYTPHFRFAFNALRGSSRARPGKETAEEAESAPAAPRRSVRSGGEERFSEHATSPALGNEASDHGAELVDAGGCHREVRLRPDGRRVT